MNTARVQAAPGVHLAVDDWAADDRAVDDRAADDRASDGHEPGARAFVLVHGLASNARLWDGVARELSARGHRVVMLDQRGHGRSSKPDKGYDFESITDDLRAVVDALGLARPIVAGQSWGGNVVVEFAARFPGRAAAIAAVDGGVIELGRQFPEWEACAKALAPPELDGLPASRLEALIRAHHPDWPEEGIAGTLSNFEVRADGTVRPWLSRANHMSILRSLWEHKPSDCFPAITEPVLFIPARDENGGRIATTDALDGALAKLKDGRVQWMTGDHDLHAQHPVAVARALTELRASV